MIVLMGVAGAGKSVQGKLLADDYGYAWLSTGELLRVLVTGKRRHEMLSGKLLSDAEVIKVVDTVLNLLDTSQEFVIDGFPRTVPQADWLLDQTRQGRFPLTAVINLQADETVVHERLKKRGRPDDIEETIAQRFKEHKEVTLPIIDHFKKESITIHNIDANQTPAAVHASIMKVISKNT